MSIPSLAEGVQAGEGLGGLSCGRSRAALAALARQSKLYLCVDGSLHAG